MFRLSNFLALVIGISISFLFLESSLRLFKFKLLPYLAINSQPCIYIQNESTGYLYKSDSSGWINRNFEMRNHVVINGEGFHDHDRTGHVEKTSWNRILAVGDSFTASLHVPINKTWAKIIEKELPQSTVVNAGLDGTGTNAHLAILKQHLLLYKPNMVLLAFYENDVKDLNRRKRYRECYKGYVLRFENEQQRNLIKNYVEERTPGPIINWLFRKSYTFRLVSYFLNPGDGLLRNNMVSPTKIGLYPLKAARTKENLNFLLQQFQQLSVKYDFRFLIIPVPTKKSITASLDVLVQNTSPDLLANIEVVDLSPLVIQIIESKKIEYSDLFWKYDGHFNIEGNEIFGEAVAEILKQ